MNIVNCDKGYSASVNFVDKNNVVLGYDMSSSCCECYGWFISDMICTEQIEGDESITNPFKDVLDKYAFDKSFIQVQHGGGNLDEGGIAVFKLISDDGDKPLYVHLWNCQNGYYGHGFKFADDKFVIKEEYI